MAADTSVAREDGRWPCTEAGCDISFLAEGSVKKHVKNVHLGRRDFSCGVDECDARYTTSFSRKMHELTVHGGRRFACDVAGCEKKFTQSNSLQSHKQVMHEGRARRYNLSSQIAGCDSRFSRKAKLEIHRRTVHDGRRDFACDVAGCKWKFGEKRGLDRHVRAVHDGRPNCQCQVPGCGSRFSRVSYLTDHMRMVHKEAPGMERSGQALNHLAGSRFAKRQRTTAPEREPDEVACDEAQEQFLSCCWD